MTFKSNDPVAHVYSRQDGSGSLPFFAGKQYGTGWLRTLARFAFPILKTVVGAAGNIAANTASDLIDQKKSFKESLKDNAINEASSILRGKKRSSNRKSSINRTKKGRIGKHNTIFA